MGTIPQYNPNITPILPQYNPNITPVLPQWELFLWEDELERAAFRISEIMTKRHSLSVGRPVEITYGV